MKKRFSGKGPLKLLLYRKKILIICLLCIVFVLSPMFQVVKSYVVMSIYSKYHESQSFLEDEGIDIRMKGGLSTFERDYFPFVMTYDTSLEYSAARNEDIELVVLYNFGYMEWLKGASVMYDPASDFYSGFYGMYVAKVVDESRQFGVFDDGSLNLDEIMDVTDFDLKELVLDSVGMYKSTVEYTIIDDVDFDQAIYKESFESMDIDDKRFYVINATMNISGLGHSYVKDYQAYIQYGKPHKSYEPKESFKTIPCYGKIYVYFDEASKVSYFAYIIAPSEKTLNETEVNFIKTLKIHK